MGRLRAAMQSRFKERDEDVKIHTPRNLETLNLSFRGERVAKVRVFVSYHCRFLQLMTELVVRVVRIYYLSIYHVKGYWHIS